MSTKVPSVVSALFLAAASASTAVATVTCPSATTLPEAPVTWSPSHHYYSYKGIVFAALGLSHEYICHISQPDRQSQYCTLESYPSVLNTDAQTANRNNIIRLVSILNTSPGLENPSRLSPYPNEQPFQIISGHWDLTQPNSVYYDNLERVVCEAYNRDILVEVTLLDPWDGAFANSAFNKTRTVNSATQGFALQRHFSTFENLAAQTDTTAGIVAARNAQKDAVIRTVQRLKKYPNVIYEIANEPDFTIGSGFTVQDVLNWQAMMVGVVQGQDSTHMIQINGHTDASFGWQTLQSKVATLHYTFNGAAPRFGAIQVERNTGNDPNANGRSLRILGLNENSSVPDFTGNPNLVRTANDERAESWEFIMNGGGLFDGYSLDRSNSEAIAFSHQLSYLVDFLTPPVFSGGAPQHVQNLDAMQQTTCNGGNWCTAVNSWGVADLPTGPPPAPVCTPTGFTPNLYWSTIKSAKDLVLYLHHGVFRSSINGKPNDGYREISCGNGSTKGFRTTLNFSVPSSGCWNVTWKEPSSGVIRYSALMDLQGNQSYAAPSPPYYTSDMLFYVGLWRSSSCF